MPLTHEQVHKAGVMVGLYGSRAQVPYVWSWTVGGGRDHFWYRRLWARERTAHGSGDLSNCSYVMMFAAMPIGLT